MTKFALPRDLDLDALVEILAQTLRERPTSESCKAPTCCGKCADSTAIREAHS